MLKSSVINFHFLSPDLYAVISDFSFCCCLVTKLWPTLCDPMDRSTPDSSILHHLPVFAQIHVHWFGDTTNHLILCCPLLLLSIFPSIMVFSSKLAHLQFMQSPIPTAAECWKLDSLPTLGKVVLSWRQTSMGSHTDIIAESKLKAPHLF